MSKRHAFRHHKPKRVVSVRPLNLHTPTQCPCDDCTLRRTCRLHFLACPLFIKYVDGGPVRPLKRKVITREPSRTLYRKVLPRVVVPPDALRA